MREGNSYEEPDEKKLHRSWRVRGYGCSACWLFFGWRQRIERFCQRICQRVCKCFRKLIGRFRLRRLCGCRG